MQGAHTQQLTDGCRLLGLPVPQLRCPLLWVPCWGRFPEIKVALGSVCCSVVSQQKDERERKIQFLQARHMCPYAQSVWATVTGHFQSSDGSQRNDRHLIAS